MSASQGPVVVGVDGSGAAAAALEWASAEAARRHAQLVVAFAGHVPNADSLTAGTLESATHETCNYGRELLDDAVATIAENTCGVDVRTVLRDAHPADLLTELSEHAELLVVGRTHAAPLARFVFGSVPQRVAGRAPCPVVVVTDNYHDAPAGAPVVVGVSTSANGFAAMRFACAEAMLRGAALVAIRSWPDLVWTMPGLGAPAAGTLESLRDGQQAVLEEWIATAHREFPELAIDAQLTAHRPEVALLNAAQDAALLVVGCRRQEDAILSPLGPLTSWLLHHAPCPIAVVGTPGLAEQASATAEDSARTPQAVTA
jgi:nucleotide-binding universal stress UspA family protein